MPRWAALIFAAVPLWAAGVQVNVRFTPARPSLSGTIRMDVTVTGAAGPDLIVEPADIPPDCVRILSASGSGLRQILTLDPLRPGDCTIPPFQTHCLRGRTDSCGVRSAAITIPIGTVVANPAQADIRDKEEAPVLLARRTPKDAGMGMAAWIAIGGLFLGGLGWVAFRSWAVWRGDPAGRARRRLRKAPPGDFSHLVGVLREYLDARLELGADRCSSPELMAALRERSIGQGSTARALEEFLAACDRGRFGGVPMAPGEFEGAAERCDTVIQYLDFDIERRTRAGF